MNVLDVGLADCASQVLMAAQDRASAISTPKNTGISCYHDRRECLSTHSGRSISPA